MPSQNAVAVGGSRGLGRGAVEALAARGFDIAVVGRDERALGSLAAEVRGVRPVVGDATDETLAQRLLAERKPDLLLLTAGAPPALGPFHELSWEQFETNWRVDTKLAFVWLRAALRQPLPPGAHIIVVSSGAAVAGSPVSGGYAAAKRAQWFLAQYAATEIERAKLAIRVHCVLPQLNPSTDLGRAGVGDDEFAKRLAPFVTPAVFGAAIAELAADPGRFAELAYRLSGAGLAPLPAS